MEEWLKSGILSKQNIIVTGGSRGIGAATVKLAASCGARVGFSFSSREDLAEDLIRQLPGEGHFYFPLRFDDDKTAEANFLGALEKMGEISGLVNNAGVTKDQLILRMKNEDFDQVLHTNLRGTFFCSRLAVKPMVKQRKGSIVNVSSVVARMGNAGQVNYCASKAGLEGLSRSLAREVGSRGVRVNCVAPGFIETDMTKDLNSEVREGLLERIPLGRLGQSADVAAMICFLLSPLAAYVTGQTILVDGGMLMI